MNRLIRPWRAALSGLLLGAALAAGSAAADPAVAGPVVAGPAVAGPAVAGPAVAGIFKRVEGSVTISHGGSSQAAQVGMPVYQSDRVSTGADGSAGITFEDSSLLSLGPSASLDIDRFAFDMTTRDGAFELSLTKGRLAVISGEIAKHQQDAMKVRTPSSTLGVRGTEFVVEVGGGS